MVRLKNWSFRISGDAYQPPECWKIKLHGNVYNHPRFSNGHEVTTSRVESINKDTRIIKCHSRDYYLDGPADPEWVQYLKDNNYYEKYKDFIE